MKVMDVLGRAWILFAVCCIMSRVDCQVEGSAADSKGVAIGQPDDLVIDEDDIARSSALSASREVTCGLNEESYIIRYDEQSMPVSKCRCKKGFGGTGCLKRFPETATAPTLNDVPYQRAGIDFCNPNHCENGMECIGLTKGYRCVPKRHCGSPTPCQNGGTCVDLPDGFWCNCAKDWYGKYCESGLSRAPCGPPNPCFNGGNCTVVLELINSFKCACPDGFTGSRCLGDYCNPNRCKNGGTCVREPRGYSCLCPPGWDGLQCQDPIPPCGPRNPCQNGGTCFEFDNDFLCVCDDKWKGKFCEIPDPCGPINPCFNGGTCYAVPGFNSFTCICRPGFTGSRCRTSTSPCTPNPCANGGTCALTNSGFNCTCTSGWHGRNCTKPWPCGPPNPCFNGGTCDVPVPGINMFMCTCPPGFTGGRCRNRTCSPNPCENDGTCFQSNGGVGCICKHGFTGYYCETPLSCGPPNPCFNGGTCTVLVSGKKLYECICPVGYSGNTCLIDQCRPNPCLYGGVCIRNSTSPFCLCLRGFTGDRCENHVCNPNPCRNGGACSSVPSISGYKCWCKYGYTGSHCEHDPCNSYPCKNGGTCTTTSGMPWYKCRCTAGWDGDTCENPIPLGDACIPNPCLNGCRCKTSCKHEGGYFCEGDNGLLGKNCSIPAPNITCGPTEISIQVDSKIVYEYGGPTGFNMFMASIYSSSLACFATFNGAFYDLTLPSPFTGCGATATIGWNGTTSVSNTIWLNKPVAGGLADMPIPLVQFICRYDQQYSAITSLKPVVGIPTTLISTGQLATSKIELCKTESFCSQTCPVPQSLTQGAIYTVGQKLHLRIKPSTPGVSVGLNDMFLSCNNSLQQQPITAPVALAMGGCLPKRRNNYHPVEVRQAGVGICASFEVPKLTGCTVFYIHAKMRACNANCASKYGPCVGRRRRSVDDADDVSLQVYGPIFVFKAANGVMKRIIYPKDEDILDFNNSNIIPHGRRSDEPRQKPAAAKADIDHDYLKIGLSVLFVLLTVLCFLLVGYNWRSVNAHCGREK